MLFLVVCLLFLCSCGKSNSGKFTESEESTTIIDAVTTTSISTTTATNDTIFDLIEFDNIVVYEDSNIRIELVNMFREQMKDSVASIVSFRYTNKTDTEVTFIPDYYLYDELLYDTVYGNNYSFNVLVPGRTVNGAFRLWYDTTPNITSLESIDLLYDLECHLEIRIKAEDGIYYATDSYEAVINFSEVLTDKLAQLS